MQEVEGLAHDRRRYAICIQPRGTLEKIRVDRAPVAFIDIDERKRGLKLA